MEKCCAAVENVLTLTRMGLLVASIGGIVTADMFAAPSYTLPRPKLVVTRVAPTAVLSKGEGRWFVDFGKAAFGTAELTAVSPDDGRTVTVHLGERLSAKNTVHRKPGGTIRYRAVKMAIKKGRQTHRLAIPPDKRNTGGAAVKMPKDLFEVLPFRYVELEGWPGELDKKDITQLAVHVPFDEGASAFSSSDETLNAVWDLCKYSIKATSFLGVYVDGDRERIPYEADAYINQLCHYGVDRDFATARYSHEYLMLHPTWPTEWPLHSVLMAWADYLYSGELTSARAFYDDLKVKTLSDLAREDGLISTRTGKVTRELVTRLHFSAGFKPSKLRDIVDWPAGERDKYDFKDVNTVVNAFHHRTLVIMGELAEALGKPGEAQGYKARAERVAGAFNEKLFNSKTGLYVDGEGSTHSSLHANMIPMALGLVPEPRKARVAKFIKSKGMACSVYGAQYLLEALYEAGEAEAALALMLSRERRSWWNMIREGSTVALEAWGQQYKPNLDWNHAWGAVPANIIPRYLLGVRPLEPGFKRILVAPQPGSLAHARGKVPALPGAVQVDYAKSDSGYRLSLELPKGTTARVVLPETSARSTVLHNDKPARSVEGSKRFTIDPVGSGKHVFEVTVR